MLPAHALATTTTSTSATTTTSTSSSTSTSTLHPKELDCSLVLSDGIAIFATTLLRCRVRAALRPAFDEPGCVVNRARNPYSCFVSDPESAQASSCGKRGRSRSPAGCPACVKANREGALRSMAALVDRVSPQIFCGIAAPDRKTRRKGRVCSRKLVKSLRRMIAETVRCRTTEAERLYAERLNGTAAPFDVRACEDAALAKVASAVPEGCCFDAAAVAREVFDGIGGELDGAFCTCPSGPDGLCRVSEACIRGYCDGVACRITDADGGQCDPVDVDVNECTDDVCQGGGCVHKPRPDNVLCGVDKCRTCLGGACVSTVPCADGNPCTTDACDPAVGCAHTNLADGSSCPSDDNAGTVDACRNGVCTHLPPG